jgi:hypothetical protein
MKNVHPVMQEALAPFVAQPEPDAFKEAALPLIKYLAENHHPHVTAIITSTSAQLLEGIKTIGEITDYLKD